MSKMSKTEQKEQLAGNIQFSALHPEIELFTADDNGYQSEKYFFTYHMQKGENFETAFNNLQGLADICDKYVWGEEHGKKGNTPHIQGAFIFLNRGSIINTHATTIRRASAQSL